MNGSRSKKKSQPMSSFAPDDPAAAIPNGTGADDEPKATLEEYAEATEAETSDAAQLAPEPLFSALLKRTLADLLAYVGRTPVDAATHPSIAGLLEHLSNGQARLTYHHIAEVRGVLTNLINNAALEAFAILGMREPLLYAPTGIVYLERGAAPDAPEAAQVAEIAVEKVRGLCRQQLAQQLIGFGRDGKGLKCADYYWLFFTPRQFAAVAAIETLGKPRIRAAD